MGRLDMLAVLFSLLHLSYALRNYSVDETNPAIAYVPQQSWELTGGPLDAGGNHMLTYDSNAFATFNFTGVALYFAYPLWPYHVTTNLALDGGRLVTLNMQDFSRPSQPDGGATVASSFHLVFNDLSNSEHQVRVSVPPGDPYAIIDMFIYTTLEDDPSTSALPPTDTSPTTSPSSTSGPTNNNTGDSDDTGTQSNKSPTLAIALGSVGAVAGAGLILLLLMIYIKRRKAKSSSLIPPPLVLDGDTSSTGNYLGPRSGGRSRANSEAYRSWGSHYPVSLPAGYHVEPELGALIPSDTSNSRYTGTQWTGSSGSRYLSVTTASR